MRSINVLTIGVLLLAVLPPAIAASDPAKAGSIPVFAPAKTQVAVLPVVNGTGKRGEEIDDAMVTARERIAELFSTRGFQVVPQDKALARLTDEKIDVSDEESRGKQKLCYIGEGLSANLVVCCVVQDLDSGAKVNFFSARKVGKAKVQMKVVDSNSQAYLVNDTFIAQKKGSWILPEAVKAKGLREDALANTISTALNDFVKPYPVVAKAGGTLGEKSGAK